MTGLTQVPLPAPCAFARCGFPIGFTHHLPSCSRPLFSPDVQTFLQWKVLRLSAKMLNSRQIIKLNGVFYPHPSFKVSCLNR